MELANLIAFRREQASHCHSDPSQIAGLLASPVFARDGRLMRTGERDRLDASLQQHLGSEDDAAAVWKVEGEYPAIEDPLGSLGSGHGGYHDRFTPGRDDTVRRLQ